MTESNLFYTLYNTVEAYLNQIFGPHFLFIVVGLTTAVSIVYFIIINYAIVRLDTHYFVRKVQLKGHLDEKAMQPATSSETTNNITETNKHAEISKQTNVTFIRGTCLLLLKSLKILFGICLLLAGIAMLVLPGQGLITIVVGLSLLPFPGKDALEQKLLSLKSVQSSLNWIRKKANKAPFVFK